MWKFDDCLDEIQSQTIAQNSDNSYEKIYSIRNQNWKCA